MQSLCFTFDGEMQKRTDHAHHLVLVFTASANFRHITRFVLILWHFMPHLGILAQILAF